MKPIMKRMYTFLCRNIICQSLRDKEIFHQWLTTVGLKHKAAIVGFNNALEESFKKGPSMADDYTARLMLFMNNESSNLLEEFLNTHPEIEKFLNDHFNIIEKAAVDFMIDLCVIELDKNIDYLSVEQIKARQKESPQPPPPEIKIAPLRQEAKKEAESLTKISRVSFRAMDKLIHCLEQLQKAPFSLEQLSQVCVRLVALNQRKSYDYFIRMLMLLAKDNDSADWICNQCEFFDFKSDTPEHYEFIERCICIQLPLLLGCSKKVIENFCQNLINFSTLSYYQDLLAGPNESLDVILDSQTQLMDCWKFIYRQLLERMDLRLNEYTHLLIANLEVFLVDIQDDVQETAQPAKEKEEDDGYHTQTDSAPSSQDVPPLEEHPVQNDEINAAVILSDDVSTDVLQPEITQPPSVEHIHWNSRYSLLNDNKKRAHSSITRTQQPPSEKQQVVSRKMT